MGVSTGLVGIIQLWKGQTMKRAALLAIIVALGLAPTASATVTIDLGTVYTGATPSGTPPWISLAFTDAGADTVTLTISSLLEDSSEFITRIWFNYLTEASLAGLSISNTGGIAPSSIAWGNDLFTASGAGLFDVEIQFPPAGPPANPARFNEADTSVYTITGTGVDETDFNFYSDGSGGNAGNGVQKAAAHVQGIDVSPNSGHLGTEIIPEPASLAVWGCLAMIGVPYGIWRRRKALTA